MEKPFQLTMALSDPWVTVMVVPLVPMDTEPDATEPPVGSRSPAKAGFTIRDVEASSAGKRRNERAPPPKER
jgi:hypothetical protein